MTRPKPPRRRCPSCHSALLVVWTREVCCRVGCPRHGQGVDDPAPNPDHDAAGRPQEEDR